MATFTKNYVEATPNTPILSSAWNENVYSSQERFQKHDHTEVGDNGPKIGRAGLDTEVTDLLDQIAALETTVTNLQNSIGGILEQPIIDRITDTSDANIMGGNIGDTIKIHGSNFYSPLTVRFKSIVVPEPQVVVAPDHNSITVTIPSNVDTGSQFISVSVGASAISGRFVIS